MSKPRSERPRSRARHHGIHDAAQLPGVNVPGVELTAERVCRRRRPTPPTAGLSALRLLDPLAAQHPGADLHVAGAGPLATKMDKTSIIRLTQTN